MRKLLIVLSATFAVAVGTGVYEAFRYFPGPQPLVATAHLWSAYVFVALLLATAVVRARTRAKERAWSVANVALGVVAVAAVVAIVTGPMLQWDQLALWAVTIGDLRGVFLSDSVKFILRGSEELAPSEFRRDVWLHILVLPLIAAGGLGVLWYTVTRSRASVELPEPEPKSVEVTA